MKATSWKFWSNSVLQFTHCVSEKSTEADESGFVHPSISTFWNTKLWMFKTEIHIRGNS